MGCLESNLNSNSGIVIASLENAEPGGNHSFYYKRGQVVTFFFDLSPIASSKTLTVFTFPSGFRPLASIRFPLTPVVHDQTELSVGTAFAVINENGAVQIYMSSVTRIFLCGSFAVK